ncbi:MAG: MBL fold metallo-hydrolase [Carboxylicivirga sp.]|nr:MBL fold metallo-hydrolase [Carboxylicivirga sp.]
MKKVVFAIVTIIALSNCTTHKQNDMEKVNIQLIRNATLKLNYGGKTLLLDPMLSPKQSFMSFVVPDINLTPTIDMPVSVDEVVNGVDAVLLTHAHPDHLDPAAVEALPKDILFFAQIADKEPLSQMPFSNVSLINDKEMYDGISIIRTNGKHGPDELFETLGTVSGYILQAKNYPSIYIVGDCLFDDDIRRTIATYHPDIIITNSGGAKFMGTHTILMDADATVQVAKLAPNAKVIAVHMEALDHCTVTREALKNEAEKAGVQIVTPADGEIIEL